MHSSARQWPRAWTSRPLAAVIVLVVIVAAIPFIAAMPSPAQGVVPAVTSGRYACPSFGRADADGRFIAREDLAPATAAVDGDDLLALVDRSPRWSLASSYAPRDLVDVRDMRASSAAQCLPPDRQCLRRQAAVALRAMRSTMRDAGERLWIDSAFRAYGIQCAVFGKWAYRDHHGFCSATVFSALPGHSQHQLGTAVDVFTESWVAAGARFRRGFGCSPGGRWIAAHAWEHGFVLPYPLHPDYRAAGSDCEPRTDALESVDPRTGYKYEPWHVRYVGVENAAAFHAAWLASGPGSAREITLEQFLRTRRGLAEPIEPPTCDGCACTACASFHGAALSSAAPCAETAIELGADGLPLAPATSPALVDATVTRNGSLVTVQVTVDVARNTFTQPPIVTPVSALAYSLSTSFEELVVVPGGVSHAFVALADTWRIGIGLQTVGFPWRAAIVESARDGIGNGINARIPARAGRVVVSVPIAGIPPGSELRVGLLRGTESTALRGVRAP